MNKNMMVEPKKKSEAAHDTNNIIIKSHVFFYFNFFACTSIYLKSCVLKEIIIFSHQPIICCYRKSLLVTAALDSNTHIFLSSFETSNHLISFNISLDIQYIHYTYCIYIEYVYLMILFNRNIMES